MDKPTIAEAIDEAHDAMIAFNKTMYAWVLGQRETPDWEDGR